VETAYDVWRSLSAGQAVEVTTWKGTITQVAALGGRTMQTSDSPGWHLLISVGLLVPCLILVLGFGGFALVYGLRWHLRNRGIEGPSIPGLL
jgi:hypothetical protein